MVFITKSYQDLFGVRSYINAKSWTYIKNNANMVVLTFSWNFNSGLKHKTEEKLMNNVDRETGIAR